MIKTMFPARGLRLMNVKNASEALQVRRQDPTTRSSVTPKRSELNDRRLREGVAQPRPLLYVSRSLGTAPLVAFHLVNPWGSVSACALTVNLLMPRASWLQSTLVTIPSYFLCTCFKRGARVYGVP